MSRSRITKPAKLRKLAEVTGRPIVGATCRGGSDHAVLAYEADGTCWHVHRGEVTLSPWKHHVTLKEAAHG